MANVPWGWDGGAINPTQNLRPAERAGSKGCSVLPHPPLSQWGVEQQLVAMELPGPRPGPGSAPLGEARESAL